MKKTLLFVLISSFTEIALAQVVATPLNLVQLTQTATPSALVGPISKQQLTNDLNKIEADNLLYLTPDPVNMKKVNLVSQYTFRNIVKNDFSTLTIADNTATVGQFAALSIDPNTYKLAFTPYSWSPVGSDLSTHDFKWIYAFNFTTTLSNQSFLDLKNWRNVTGSFTITRLLGDRYSFDNPKNPNGTKITQADYIKPYTEMYDELKKRMIDAYDRAYITSALPGQPQTALKNRIEALNHPEFLKADDARQAYLDSISKYEQLYAKDSWTQKAFWWLKLTITPFSLDNAYYVSMADPNTSSAPKSVTPWTGSANLSGNLFKGTSTHWNFYANANVQISRKDMFTGIYTPSTFNGFSPLTDSTAILKTNQQVFQIPGAIVSPRILPDFGLEGIALKTFSSVALGIDLTYAYGIVIANEAGYYNGYTSSPSAGIIVGLKDKTGKSNINIEPYFQYNQYTHITVASNHVWGIKFSIPINSLY